MSDSISTKAPPIMAHVPQSVKVDMSANTPPGQIVRADLGRVVKESNPKDLVGVRKAPMSTVSAVVLAEVGLGMLEGASKYGRHNYRVVGVSSSVYYDAAQRHLNRWWEGEDLDPESGVGLHHITKAITALVVLRDAMIQGMCTDDRPPCVHVDWHKYDELAARIIDRAQEIREKTGALEPAHYTRLNT